MASQVSDCLDLEPWRQLKNKVVMVTGASSGLGREFCLDLAKAGCRIVAAARRVDRLKSLCDEINMQSGSSARAMAVELDVSANGATIESSVQMAWEAFGRIDALINNAGVTGNKGIFYINKLIFGCASINIHTCLLEELMMFNG